MTLGWPSGSISRKNTYRLWTISNIEVNKKIDPQSDRPTHGLVITLLTRGVRPSQLFKIKRSKINLHYWSDCGLTKLIIDKSFLAIDVWDKTWLWATGCTWLQRPRDPRGRWPSIVIDRTLHSLFRELENFVKLQNCYLERFCDGFCSKLRSIAEIFWK